MLLYLLSQVYGRSKPLIFDLDTVFARQLSASSKEHPATFSMIITSASGKSTFSMYTS